MDRRESRGGPDSPATDDARGDAGARGWHRGVDSLKTLGMLRAFIDARDWDQFHHPANLATSTTIEADELLECYPWNDDAGLVDVRGEVADGLTYCFEMCLSLTWAPSTSCSTISRSPARSIRSPSSRGAADGMTTQTIELHARTRTERLRDTGVHRRRGRPRQWTRPTSRRGGIGDTKCRTS